MLGNVVHEDNTLTDAHACQEVLQLIGSVFGAQVFLFSENDMVCYLLDSSEKICNTISGPRLKFFSLAYIFNLAANRVNV